MQPGQNHASHLPSGAREFLQCSLVNKKAKLQFHIFVIQGPIDNI